MPEGYLSAVEPEGTVIQDFPEIQCQGYAAKTPKQHYKTNLVIGYG